MTTTVKVTAHNHPATVLQQNHIYVRGPTNITETVTNTAFVLQDGQSQEFMVTDTRSIHVHEHPADKERDNGHQ